MPRFLKLSEFRRGWFIGDFEPSIFRTKQFEICVTSHKKNEASPAHYHTSSEEINLVLAGRLLVNGRELKSGDFFIYERLEVSSVEFLQNTKLLVVRVPSAPHDKVFA
jgi:hypothetical protein